MPLFGPDIQIHDSTFVHDSAQIYGKVALAEDVSVWPNVVIRAEMYEIAIGAGTNIQDFVMVHVGGACGTRVGRNCSITHHATLHGCDIGDNCLIGINATLMDGVKIGNNCIVAGHAILTEGSEFPDNAVIAGVPAKQVGTKDSSAANKINARFYQCNARNYRNGIYRFSDADIEWAFNLGTD
ncbi:MAG: carbonic anhydrase/acetyltransferase-like protein (isoleucine patch superfamily) [Bermanella sp.]|jgi:carbonic anhydrase/acetyltransferase-like protein (isoleucine patch superfamily)